MFNLHTLPFTNLALCSLMYMAVLCACLQDYSLSTLHVHIHLPDLFCRWDVLMDILPIKAEVTLLSPGQM